MNNVQSSAYRAWQKIDSETVGMQRSGKTVPDHRASATENFKEAGSSFRTIGQAWAAVAEGKAIMGGGNPSSRVARAEGFWGKAGTAIVQHGSNGVMAAALTVMGAAGGTVDAIHGVIHGAAGLFQSQDG